jgi:hypothetical protein
LTSDQSGSPGRFASEPPERCTWCGEDVERDDGFRLAEPAGERRAAFCRLEHVVPWALQGAHWEAGTIEEPSGLEASLVRCATCAEPLPETRLLLVRHRGEHRIPDAFCSPDHLADWAKAGGRWR